MTWTKNLYIFELRKLLFLILFSKKNRDLKQKSPSISISINSPTVQPTLHGEQRFVASKAAERSAWSVWRWKPVRLGSACSNASMPWNNSRWPGYGELAGEGCMYTVRYIIFFFFGKKHKEFFEGNHWDTSFWGFSFIFIFRGWNWIQNKGEVEGDARFESRSDGEVSSACGVLMIPWDFQCFVPGGFCWLWWYT